MQSHANEKKSSRTSVIHLLEMSSFYRLTLLCALQFFLALEGEVVLSWCRSCGKRQEKEMAEEKPQVPGRVAPDEVEPLSRSTPEPDKPQRR